MFRFFTINDPYRLIFAFILFIGLRVVLSLLGQPLSIHEFKSLLIGERLSDGFLMYKELYDYASPLSALTYKYLDFVFGRTTYGHHIVSTIFVCINAVIFNMLLVRNKAFQVNNYLPGFFYVLVSFSIVDSFQLSPQLMATTFILLALHNVFRRIDNHVSDELFLYSGLFVGVAFLFYLPSILYFLLFLVMLMIFSSAIIRRLLLYVYGFFVPVLIVALYYFWFDSFTYFWTSFVWRGILNERIVFESTETIFLVGIVPAIWFVVSFIYTASSVRLGIYETKVLRSILFLGLTGIIAIMIDVERSVTQLILFVPLVAYFLTHLALNIKNRYFRLTLPTIIILSLTLSPFYWFHYSDFQPVVNVMNKNIGFTDRHVMVLDDDLEAYLGQKIAGPFVDPVLSKKHLELLDYYGSATEMYIAIDKNRPQVIIDNWGIMQVLFERFPLLENSYRAGSQNRYYLKANN